MNKKVGDYIKSRIVVCKILEVKPNSYRVCAFNLTKGSEAYYEGYVEDVQMPHFALEVSEEEKLRCLEILLEH